MTTPADPNVGQPIDPNAAEQYAAPPQVGQPGEAAPAYPAAPGDVDPEQPVNSVADQADPEPGGASVFVQANEPDEPGLTGDPAQGGGVSEAAPGALASGGDNVATAYNRTGLVGGSDRAPGTGVDPELMGAGGDGGSPPAPMTGDTPVGVTADPELGGGQGTIV